jgi:hypothetical protein
MTLKTFALQISCLAFATALLNFCVPLFAEVPKFAWASWILFLNITVIAFFLAKQSVKMAYKNAFVGVFLGITAFKLLAAPTLVFWYKTHFSPTNTMFIFPFMLFFIVFMAYETYFLQLIAKE